MYLKCQISLVLIAFLFSCSSSERDNLPEGTKTILMIGNSYTSLALTKNGTNYNLNNLPEVLQTILGPKYFVSHCSHGGYALENHYKESVCKERIEEREWDYIILQEQSENILRDYRTSEKYLKKLISWNIGPKYLIFQNWGNQDRPSEMPSLVQRTLVLANDINGRILPIASSLKQLGERNYSLFADDKVHLNVYGIYAAAYTIAKFFEPKIDKAINFSNDIEAVKSLLPIEENQRMFGDSFNYILSPKALKGIREHMMH